MFVSDDTHTLGPQALPTFRQFTCRGALSPRCRPGPSPRKPVEVNGTNSPAGTCLGRLLPAEGMGRSLISILDVAQVRGKTSVRVQMSPATEPPLTVQSGIPSGVVGLHRPWPGP